VSPTVRDVITESAPGAIGAIATQLTSGVAGASVAGLTTGGIFLAPLFLPGLISRLAPADPIAIFSGGENLLPVGTDLSIFGGPFVGRKTTVRPFLIKKFGGPASGFQRQPDLPEFSQLAIAAANEFSFNPEQAALGTQFIEDAKPVVAQLPTRFPFFLNKKEALENMQAANNQKLASDIERARREQRERVFNEPVFRAIIQAQAQGLIPGAVPSPKYLEARGFEPAAPPATTQEMAPPVSTLDPVRVDHQRPAVVQERQLSQRTEAPPMPNVQTNLPAGGGFGSAVQGFFGGLGQLLTSATPVLQTILPQLLPQRSVPLALPGGAAIANPAAQQFAIQRAQQQLSQQFSPAGFFPQAQPAGLFDFFGQGGALGLPGGDLTGGACITPVPSRQTMRLPARVDVPTRDAAGNQRFTTFKNMGRPILFTGDVAAAKRVKKVASKLGSFRSKRGGR